jgi:uncharacterized protein (DUF2384 family)
VAADGKPHPPEDPNSTKRIFELAGTLFGPQADAWLEEERAWFGDKAAVSLMMTPAGRQRVMEVLKTLAAGGDPAVPGSEIPNANSVLLLAKMLFADGADKWLKAKRPIFNEQSALELLPVPEGRQLVMTVLKDIRAGKRPA